MKDNKVREANDESIKLLLASLDILIEELDVESVQKDANFNPMEVFSVDFLSKEQNDELVIQKTKDFLEKLKDVTFPGGVLQYSLISEKMFDKKYSIEAAENISEKILKAAELNFQEFLDSDEMLKVRFYKLIDHIQLASFQISEIAQHSIEKHDDLMQEILQSRIELENLKKAYEDNIKETEDNIKKDLLKTKIEIEKELSKVYVQFVTILGIFSAIVLSVFGGLQLITSSFQNLHKIPAWKAVLMSSLIALAVLCMLFLLTRWVSTITNRTFNYESERTLLQIITDNGAFSIGLFVFSYLAIAAVILSSHEITITLKSILNGWNGLPIIVLLTLPLVAGLALLVKSIDVRKK